MRITTACVAIALAMVPPAAIAQTPQDPTPQETTTRTTTPWTGVFNIGVRGTTMDGDGTRYERYRDLGSGLFVEGLRIFRERDRTVMTLSADHIGWSDQRFVGNVERFGRVKGWFTWDQIPMLFSRTTRTLFSGVNTGDLEIADAVQTQVQAQPSLISPLGEKKNSTCFRPHYRAAAMPDQPQKA